MINEQLYREEDEQEIDEVFAEAPVNKTLLIMQLTNDMPIRPEQAENLASLAEVFDYYKPSFQFELMNTNGNTVTETINFTSLEDFYPENLIQRSPCLSELRLLSEKLTEMNKKISSNSELTDILVKPARKKYFTEMLKALINDLEKET